MKIKFTGVPGEPEIEEITMFGYSFPKGKAVDVPDSDKLAQMKLSNHPHFKGGDVPQEALILPQTIPSVENSMLVSDGHEAVTEQERNAVNTLSEMEGLQKVHSYEEILEAKGESHGDDFRVSPRVLRKLTVLSPGQDANPEDLEAAIEKLKAVHASLKVQEVAQWTLNDIPDFAEEPYVSMACFLAGPDYTKPVPVDLWQFGLSEIRSGAQLKSVERTRAEYF